MCRHLARIGRPATLTELLLEPPHSLVHQSYAPTDMRGGGTINADGFGAGWYPGPDGAGPKEAATRYRSAQPIWSDTAFAAVAAATRTGAVLAAVRSATTGMPVTSTAAAPFAEGRWLFSHNGVVRGWPDSVARIAARLPVTDLLTLDAPTDAALLWALVRHRLRAGEEPGAVLAATVREVESAAPGSRLNLLLTDGTLIWGTTWGHALSVRVTATEAIVASEPYDSRRGWEPVPDGRLVVATPGRLSCVPLPDTPPEGARSKGAPSDATADTATRPAAPAPAGSRHDPAPRPEHLQGAPR